MPMKELNWGQISFDQLIYGSEMQFKTHFYQMENKKYESLYEDFLPLPCDHGYFQRPCQWEFKYLIDLEEM